MSVIEVSGLKKSFQGREVIRGLNFELKKGKCIALLGPNGAGKTTTLGMLSGLLTPTEGSITFFGSENKEDFRKWIGFLPQSPVFYEWMTGFEYLKYVGKLAGLSREESKERAIELLKITGIEEAKNQRVGKYSGGMKQRLGIAQAIIHRPSLVMLDEPVSALDPLGRREVLELFKQLKKETSVLFSTHILRDAEEVCDEILFLHNGKIVESGTLEKLKQKYYQAKIDMFFDGHAEQYIESLTCKDQFESVQITGNHVCLIVKDIDTAKKLIWRDCAEKNLPLTKFEISSMSLEDVFMKVVKS